MQGVIKIIFLGAMAIIVVFLMGLGLGMEYSRSKWQYISLERYQPGGARFTKCVDRGYCNGGFRRYWSDGTVQVDL